MIRPARPTDEPEIRTCAEQAYARYVPLIGRKPAPMFADYAAQIAAAQVSVALRDHVFLGFIVFYAVDRHMLLENVAVMPACAGQGVGKALIDHCEQAARQQRLTDVQLYTHQRMTDNLAIYTRLGYVEVGRRTEDGFQRVYFEKTLL
ncbi:GNAT family N-acetyltransferase [Pseudomonas sp. RP23018S]|uniref:GNAT family N-acetyltransferase n=1 Tax=Pseudomonas sp. RP23018S TaxID=3096037 RepID=UPI002ACA0500|nr:GNAT family N-acetyltransferase [Pseudomonas sp. RP23018S]MDZ5602005.1 GNAT family N-acetyltransferase [Pseudomonas sp. RP23018S]